MPSNQDPQTAQEFFGTDKNLPSADEFFGPATPSVPRPSSWVGPKSQEFTSQGPYEGAAADHLFSSNTEAARVLDAVGQGFKDGWGSAGQSLYQNEIEKEARDKDTSYLKAASESWLRPAAAAMDFVTHFPLAVGGAVAGFLGQTGQEIGGPIGELMKIAASGAIPEGGFESAPAVDHITAIHEARAEGVVGPQGEKGFFETEPPPPEEEQIRQQAADEAGQRLGKNNKILPEVPKETAPALPDIHTLARQIAPETFSKYDRLLDIQENLRLTKTYLEGQFETREIPKKAPADLIVARRSPDGEVTYGEPGQFHSDLFSSDAAYEKANDEQMGFATEHGAPFMSRSEALDWVEKNQPGKEQRDYEDRGLEMGSYKTAEAKEIDRGVEKITPETPGNLKTAASLNQVRSRLQDIDEQLRDLLPETSAAKNRVQELLASESKEGSAYRDYVQAQALENAIRLQELSPDVSDAYHHAESLVPAEEEHPEGGPQEAPQAGLAQGTYKSTQDTARGPGGPPKPSETEVSQVSPGAIEKGLHETFEGTPEFQGVNYKTESENAKALVDSNPEQAKRVALGLEASPGVHPQAVLRAVKELAYKTNDTELMERLADSPLNQHASKAGQTLSLRRGIFDFDPVNLMSQLNDARLRAAGGLKAEGRIQNITDTLKDRLSRFDENWKQLVSQVTCPPGVE